MPKTAQQIIAEYEAFLDASQKLFGIKTPEQIQTEVKAGKYAPAQLAYTAPEAFLNDLVKDGGLVPMILENGKELLGAYDKAGLDARLQQWEAMKTAYHAILNEPKNFGPAFASWKRDFRELSDGQARAVYAARIFQNSYTQNKDDAPFHDMFVPFSETNKFIGDCDSKSYLCSALMLEAKDAQGVPIFAPSDIKIEYFDRHARIQLKSKIIFETATNTTDHWNSDVYYVRSLEDRFSEINHGKALGAYSFPTALGMNYLGEERAKSVIGNVIAYQKGFNVLRASCLAKGDSLLNGDCMEQFHLLISRKLTNLMDAYLAHLPLDSQQVADVYKGSHTIMAYALQPQSVPDKQYEEILLAAEDCYKGLNFLREMAPTEFAKLQALDVVNGTNQQPTGTIHPTPKPVQGAVVPGKK